MTGSFESEFAHRVAEDGVLIARSDLVPALCVEGLDRLAVWRDHTQSNTTEAHAPGRGATAVVSLPSGALRLKQLRRGGLLGPIWKDRFFGTGRLLENLEIPAEAIRRGVPTPEAVALFLVPGPPMLYRGWLAVEEIEDAADLWKKLEADEEIPVALNLCGRAIRKMHDAGLDHPDLNIGNLLIRHDEAIVIDLDKARLADSPVSLARRRANLARLDRSYVKHLQPTADRRVRFMKGLIEAYAAGDRELRGALALG